MSLRHGADGCVVSFDESRIDSIFAQVDGCHLHPAWRWRSRSLRRPVYRKGFGFANIELPVVLAPTMRMRIASITKHFAALAYALLCEQGKARMDDRIAVQSS